LFSGKILKHSPSKLLIFVSASIALHIAVLSSWYFTRPPTIVQDDVLIVKLIEVDTISTTKKIKNKEPLKPSTQASKDSKPTQDSKPDLSPVIDQISKGQAFILPPSAELRYTTLVNGNQNQDTNIKWQQENSSYQLNVEYWFPFVGDILFKSLGNIDIYGISPNTYEEKVGKRLRSVFFDREKNSILMTANNETAPLAPGTQDRFSVIFQLASLVGGNPDVDERGVARMIPIADIRKVDEWVFISSGDIEAAGHDGEIINARHFRRQARTADDKRSLEVWLAKEYGWLPIKIMQTEPNGTVYEMQLIGMVRK
jgi:hypothetical protein